MQKTYYLETLPGRYLGLEAPLAAVGTETSAVVEKSRDLMGLAHAWTLGYEKKLTLGPLYAGPGEQLYAYLRGLLDRQSGPEVLGTGLLEVSGDGSALRREARIVFTGAAEGKLAFCLHFTGRERLGRWEGGRFRW